MKLNEIKLNYIKFCSPSIIFSNCHYFKSTNSFD